MPQNDFVSTTNQLFAFGSFRNWCKLLWGNRDIDPVYIKRLLFVLLTSSSTAPLRMYEQVRYGNIIKKVQIKEPPVFILGHWRSGTTYLHYLMSRDKNWGYPSTFQTVAPELFLVGTKTIKPLLAKVVPATRIGDNVPLGLDNPQEEEFALSSMTLHSFYHHWSFPRRATDYFNKYVLFEDVPETVIDSWKETYLTVLRKTTFQADSKRLILKNPANTGRIKILLDMFPDAKFIHIHRNPYIVFFSMRQFYEKLLQAAQFHKISREEVEANTLLFYKKIMRQFLVDKTLIPPENFIEVKFRNLTANPLTELERLYTELKLPGFSEAREDFQAYITSQTSYQKNKHNINKEDLDKVTRHWQFALDEWGYNLPVG